MSRRPIASGILLAFVVLFGSRESSASGSVAGDAAAVTLLVIGGYVLEVGIPDLRYEIGDDDRSWVLSWPVLVTLARRTEDSDSDNRRQAAIALLVEPQWNRDHGKRVLLGTRLTGFLESSLSWGVALEGAGVLGSDGHGGMVGGGIIWGVQDLAVGVFARRTVTHLRHRTDVSFDLMFPFPSL